MPLPTSLFANASASFGAMPKYSDMFGGGGTQDVVYGVTDPLDQDVAETRVHNFCQRMAENMKSYRATFAENWDYYYNLFVGRQWMQPGASSLRSPRLRSWQAKPCINYIYSIIDTIVATIFDNDPKPSLVAGSKEQLSYVEEMQAAIDQVWHDQKALDKCEQAYTNACIYGTGYLKVIYNHRMKTGQGGIEIFVVPSDNIYISKGTVSLGEDRTDSILELKTVPVSELRRMYPKKASSIRPDPAAMDYAEKKQEGGFGSDWSNNRPVNLYSPVEDQPRIADKTDFSVPPYRPMSSSADYLVEVGELWTPDHTVEEIEEQFVAAYDPWRRPIMGTRIRRQPKYPFGRLITFGGGVVFQDEPSPYRWPPYVVFRDIVLPGEFYGMGEPAMIGDQQLEVNKRRAQIMDNATHMGNSIWVVDHESGVSSNMIFNTPGLIIRKKAGTEVHRVAPPEMPGWILQAASVPVSDMLTISGASGAQGGAPKGARSGVAMQTATAFMTQRIRRKASQVKEALVDLTRILITLIQDNYTTQRMVRVRGSMGKADFVPFDRRHARGQWDIRIEAGSDVAASQSARRQEALQLYGMQVLDKEALLEVLEWPNRDEILRRMGQHSQSQVPQYMGYPGMPNPDRSENSGYSLSVRAEQPPPPMIQPPAPPPRPRKPPGRSGGKKGAGPPGGMPTFGMPVGVLGR